MLIPRGSSALSPFRLEKLRAELLAADLPVRTQASNTNAESSRLVRESLDAQVQATSGVSLDEESINMLSYQRQFQAAARFVATIDETLQTLLSIV